MNTTQKITLTLKKLPKLIGIALACAVLIFVIAWAPVAYKIVFWCDLYPDSLADCR